MTASPTPENVADLLAGGDSGNDWLPSISATGNVVNIAVAPVGEYNETDLSKIRDFEAYVFQAEPEPPVAAEPIDLDPEFARELTYFSVGETYEGWTVVENKITDTTSWLSHHWLIIRNGAGEHFSATYSKGLTEMQRTRPWENDTVARFEPAARRRKVISIDWWVTPSSS
ncbi:hypothetical protein [Streptosporangium roseum]|uniref:hypothetical protein n=1 Tax=Streptosporangium roseum TaxID=2001 RepID=UPI003321BA78